MMLDAGTCMLFGLPNMGTGEEGRLVLKSLATLAGMLFALPIDLPGTACYQAKKVHHATCCPFCQWPRYSFEQQFFKLSLVFFSMQYHQVNDASAFLLSSFLF
jgi:hypothetical protein